MIYPQLIGFGLLLLCSSWKTGRLDNTFIILFLAAYVNAVANHYLDASEPYLLAIYSSIDAMAIIAIARHGGRQRLFQCSLLALSVMAHLLCQIDVNNGTNMIYDNYLLIGAQITIFQILGAGYGMAKRVRPDNYHIS